MRQYVVPVAAVADLLCVLVFVVVGRTEHDESGVLAGVAATAWPFVAALATGWIAARAWRSPTRVVPTGVIVWPVTVVGGMLLRVLTGGTTQLSFIVVTTLFLGATLVGWRALATPLRGRGATNRRVPNH